MMLKKLYQRIKNKTLYDREKKLHSIDEEKEYFNCLPVPTDYIEASFLKYKCMCWYNYPLGTRLIFNIGAAICLPFCALYYTIKGKPKKRATEKGVLLRKNPIIEFNDIIPAELIEEKKMHIISAYDFRQGAFDEESKAVYREIRRRYFFSFYFRFLVLLKITEYTGWIARYSPEKILVYAFERDVALPIKTKYCECKGVQHIGFMHGDFIYSVDKAYIELTKFYIWDDYYGKILKQVGAPEEQFVTYFPEKLKSKIIPIDNPEYFAVYYFSAESERLIRNVYKTLSRFKENGYRCKVRPHPRYSNISLIKNIFKDIEVEEPASVSIDESLSNTKNVIGLKSTVMLQAYYRGISIIIDDISDPEFLEFLQKGEFILLKEKHLWLSECIEMFEKSPVVS